ncbi:MAG: hypothetical protein J5649_06785 [Lachnospiraceae bacterium]|nr:hypothetical protein [Lachnospiraceae bacterium]
MNIVRSWFLYSDAFSDYSDYFSYPDQTEVAVEKTEEAASTSGSWAFLYILCGIVTAVLVAGIVILVTRLISRRKKNQELQNRAYLTARASLPAASFGVRPNVAQAGTSGVLLSSVMPAQGRNAVEIPGETMPMLAERIRRYLESCGVLVDTGGIGHILAAYAATGCVKLEGVSGTQDVVLTALVRLLSSFFGEQIPAAPDEFAAFSVADDTVPEHMRTKVEAYWADAAKGRPYLGIGGDTFRGILRETEEENFLPEEDWRKADELLTRCACDWLPGVRNRIIRSMESLSACLIATGTSREEAFDRALSSVLLPGICRNDGAGAIRRAAAVFGDLFGNRELPLSRRYLQTNTI